MQHIRMLFRGEVRKCLLHFAVVVGNTIVAASFAGPTRAVNGILHDFKKAPLDIITGNGIARRFDALDGEYQSYSNSLEKGILHGIILHEGFFRGERRFVLLPTGDVNDLNRFFVENYSLLEEWQDKYVSLFSSRIRSLYIYKNEDIPLWQSMRAYEINLTEKEVISTIGQMLQNKELVLPPADGTMPGSFEPGWDMRKYIKENVEGIAAEIRKMQPYHDNTNPNRKLYKAIATMGRVPLPAQADVVQALYNRLQKANYAFANGQMGTGKSIIADALVNVWHTEKKQKYTPVLLTAPATVLPKWIADEIGQDLPQARILEIKKTEDALQYIREDHGKKTGIEFVLISQDRIKLGPERWACAAVWKRITGLKKYAWHCPDCFSVLLNPDKKDDDGNLVPADWNVMAKSEPGEPIVWHQDSKVVKCPHCGAKLWQPDPHCKPRWYVARIFQKKLRRHFELYIADEIHKQKADSQRGEAFGKLVRAAKKTLGLTGTLTNGMSTAVKELFWRLAPHELLAKGFDYNTGTIAWANNYGAVESKSSRQEREGDRVRRKTRVSERPGISPRLIVEYLLNCTAFLELKDLGFPLVEKKEIPIFIDMDPEHAAAYQRFHSQLVDFTLHGVRGTVAAAINYADTPANGAEVIARWRHRGHDEERIISAPKIPGFSAKERKLVEIVRQNLAEDRGVMIFTFYSGRFDTNTRLKEVLQAHDIEATILPSSLSPERRVDWLEKHKDDKVIISNMNLIGEGIDLLPWPSLIFYQLSYNVDTVRQAGGRAWRIGQTRECRNYYLVVNGTQQMPQFTTVMAKRGHALLVEGKIDRSALADYAQDAFSTLAADIASCLASKEQMQKINARWNDYAHADLEGVTTIDEASYQAAVQEAIKRLAVETRRLCGVTSGGISWLPEGIKIIAIEKTLRRGRRIIATEGQLALNILAAGK